MWRKKKHWCVRLKSKEQEHRFSWLLLEDTWKVCQRLWASQAQQTLISTAWRTQKASSRWSDWSHHGTLSRSIWPAHGYTILNTDNKSSLKGFSIIALKKYTVVDINLGEEGLLANEQLQHEKLRPKLLKPMKSMMNNGHYHKTIVSNYRTYIKNSILYNNPSYSRILIGSRLCSIRGQTHRWRQRSFQVCFEFFEFWIWTNQNSLLSIATNQFASFCIDIRSRQSRLVCHFFVLTTFWRLLWYITEQTHGNMESIC